jgi:hypothetical protein
MNLSPHFTLSEMTRTASGLANVPTDAEVKALTALAMTLLEPVRAKFGPVSIHSGYRGPAVNAAIGGSKTSQHMKGEAADFHCAGARLEDIFDWVRLDSGLPFSQIILEGHGAEPTWIHLAMLSESTRHHQQALVFKHGVYSAAPSGRMV